MRPVGDSADETRSRRDRLVKAVLHRLSTPDAPETDHGSPFQETARFYFNHLPRLTTRPKHIQQLRQTILNLAVQGKLVPQDPNDEPANQLVAAIMEQQGLGVRGERTTAHQPLDAIPPDEVPYDLPPGWVWERLGNVGDTNVGLTYSPTDVSESGIPVLRSGNIQKGKIDLSDLVRVELEPKERVLVETGDLLICARNGSRALVGKAALIEPLPERTAFGAFMTIFRSGLNKYLHLFISSPPFRQLIDEVNTTTINQITQRNLRSTLAPIPPLAEQHRIVAKVDELMALCDELESRIAEGAEIQAKLLEATLQNALRSAEFRWPD